MVNELARIAIMKKKDVMNLSKLILLCTILCFCACEQIKDVSLPGTESNDTSDIPKENTAEKEIDIVAEPKIVPKEQSIPVEPIPVPTLPSDAVPLKKVEPSTQPLQPEFSEELLKAVKNWKFIPKSVFPLSSVTVKETVEFIAKSTSGEIIARAKKQSGEEVVALGVVGNELILSPSKTGKMRGKIGIDQTDFKQGVAYLFELRKQQRAEYELRKAQLAKAKVNENVKTEADKITEQEPLFEDLPIPGDYGHGKFCICKDCREKRLAATGSMK